MIFFSYGTLLDPEYQRELFDRVLPTVSATLHDWVALFTDSGYLTLMPQFGAVVHGALVTVDKRELAVCDAWEDVPLYARVDVRVVDVNGIAVATWAYVRTVTSGEPAPAGVLARADRRDVVRTIRQFRTTGRGHAAATSESTR